MSLPDLHELMSIASFLDEHAESPEEIRVLAMMLRRRIVRESVNKVEKAEAKFVKQLVIERMTPAYIQMRRKPFWYKDFAYFERH